VTDARAPPAGFGVNLAEEGLWCGTQAEVLVLIHNSSTNLTPTPPWGGTQAEVLALIQNSQQTGPKPGVCHNCQKPGHWSRECPEPRREGGSRRPGSPNWKKVPPVAGDPVTKTMSGKVFQWCAKCGRWTTTHATDSHTGGRDKVEANMALVLDPSAWHTDLDSVISLADVWGWIRPFCLLIQGGLLFYFFPIFLDFVIEVLFAAVPMMWEHGVTTFAPLLWLSSLLFTLWLGMSCSAPPPDSLADPEPRWKRRNRT
jgi:hypothetical protein